MWASGKPCWAVLAMVAIIPSSLSSVCMIVPCGMVLQPCVRVCQEHSEMVMMVMVTWVCCLGLGVLANDSPNHAVRRAVPS